MRNKISESLWTTSLCSRVQSLPCSLQLRAGAPTVVKSSFLSLTFVNCTETVWNENKHASSLFSGPKLSYFCLPLKTPHSYIASSSSPFLKATQSRRHVILSCRIGAHFQKVFNLERPHSLASFIIKHWSQGPCPALCRVCRDNPLNLANTWKSVVYLCRLIKSPDSIPFEYLLLFKINIKVPNEAGCNSLPWLLCPQMLMLSGRLRHTQTVKRWGILKASRTQKVKVWPPVSWYLKSTWNTVQAFLGSVNFESYFAPSS